MGKIELFHSLGVIMKTSHIWTLTGNVELRALLIRRSEGSRCRTGTKDSLVMHCKLVPIYAAL